MGGQPGGKLRRSQLALRQFQHGRHHLGLAGGDFKAVVEEKDLRRENRRTLVAVDEAVILREPGGIGRSQFKHRGLFVMEQMPGLGQGGLNAALVTNAIRTAMLFNLFAMERQHQIEFDPAGFVHFASSESASRYLDIPRRAISICR